MRELGCGGGGGDAEGGSGGEELEGGTGTGRGGRCADRGGRGSERCGAQWEDGLVRVAADGVRHRRERRRARI